MPDYWISQPEDIESRGASSAGGGFHELVVFLPAEESFSRRVALRMSKGGACKVDPAYDQVVAIKALIQSNLAAYYSQRPSGYSARLRDTVHCSPGYFARELILHGEDLVDSAGMERSQVFSEAQVEATPANQALVPQAGLAYYAPVEQSGSTASVAELQARIRFLEGQLRADLPYLRLYKFGGISLLVALVSLLGWAFTGIGVPFHPVFAAMVIPVAIGVIVMAFYLRREVHDPQS
jgi:hypothetical protein